MDALILKDTFQWSPGNENGESYVLQSDTPHQTSDPQDKRKLKEDAGKLDKFKWFISYPIYTLSMYTIPGE